MPAAPARVARRCDALQPLPETLNASQTRVLIEIAHVFRDGKPLPDDYPLDAPVDVRSVATFVATQGVPQSMPWGACVDDACDRRAERWTIDATLPKTGTEPVTLELRLERLDDAGTSTGQRFAGRLRLEHQSPQRLRDAEAATDGGSLIVTGYLLTRPDDLFRVMRCKAEQVGVREIRGQAAATSKNR